MWLSTVLLNAQLTNAIPLDNGIDDMFALGQMLFLDPYVTTYKLL